jgi:hypothetical protein
MTANNNDMSEQDKVTQASGEEVKGIESSPQNSDSSQMVGQVIGDQEDQVPEAQQEVENLVTESIDTEDSSVEDGSSVSETPSLDDEKEDSTEEEDHSLIDLSGLTKGELIKIFKEKYQLGSILKFDKLAHEIKAAFDEHVAKNTEAALEKFKADGGEQDDFEYRWQEDEKEFNKLFNEFRFQLNSLRKEAEKQKEKNLAAKTQLLNRLRDLVDGEETTLSMSAVKSIQQEWKTIGPVPASQNRNLWASFNALMDRFYDNRSIYFELKELDRKKNLESKLDLCEKAEMLKEIKELKDAIRLLNDFHEEFKHIGPVPRDEQEALWQRFKSASDAVYDRRKEFFEGQKEVFKKNLSEKEELINQLSLFAEFKADRIKDWNTKTKEILDIQKSWEKIGPVPKESGKDVNKLFWAAFKQFFYNKNLFFKELDEIRAGNQKKAEELISKAEELSTNTDWQNTANQLVKLQQEWKKLGPTPEKNRDSLYKKFKNACDSFFENRRNSTKQATNEFDQNLKRKQEIIASIRSNSEEETLTEEQLRGFVSEFNEIGFVPRKNMKEIQSQFKDAVDLYLSKLETSSVSREDFLFRLNLNKLQSDPNSIKTLNKKEHGIRKQIADLENSIGLWRNNLEFFAASKTADKLRDQFDIKIQKAEDEIDKLKKKLSILKEF